LEGMLDWAAAPARSGEGAGASVLDSTPTSMPGQNPTVRTAVQTQSLSQTLCLERGGVLCSVIDLSGRPD
jgi:hypothetical protein